VWVCAREYECVCICMGVCVRVLMVVCIYMYVCMYVCMRVLELPAMWPRPHLSSYVTKIISFLYKEFIIAYCENCKEPK